MDENIIELGIDNLDIDEINSYLPLTRRGYTRRKMGLSSQITPKNKLKLKRIDSLSHYEAVSVLSRRNIISENTEAPTDLLKNMLVALTI